MTRVAVIGGGAIGAVAAASAADAGHDVTVCVRTAFDRLVVVRQAVDHVVEARIVSSPDQIDSPADVIVVAVKVQDTPSVAPWFPRLCGPTSVVLALQNGLDPTPSLRALGPAAAAVPIVPSVAYIAAERTAPGRVVHHFANRVLLPPVTSAPLVTDALGPSLVVEISDDFPTAVWRKLVGNVVVNPITALTLRRVDVMADPAIRDLVRSLVTEAVAVAAADGAALGDDDVRAVMDLYTGDWSTRTSGSSMYYDRVAGRPLEHEALTGALVSVARTHGVAVPHHEMVLALLRVAAPAES